MRKIGKHEKVFFRLLQHTHTHKKKVFTILRQKYTQCDVKSIHWIVLKVEIKIACTQEL